MSSWLWAKWTMAISPLPVISEWRTPATDYPRTSYGHAEVVTHWYEPGVYHCYMQREAEYYEALRPLPITCLEIEGDTWMVDDPPHWWAMEAHAEAYRGHVLCVGMGLGLMVHTLAANPEVERITVVEREADVLELITPHLPECNLSTITADFHDLERDSLDGLGEVDGVLYDLFVGNAHDMFGQAIRAAAFALERWRQSPDFVVRVHGFPNPLIQSIAEAIAHV